MSSSERYGIELEPEVRAWLDTLPGSDYRAIERVADLLADRPTTLGEPCPRRRARHLRKEGGAVTAVGYHTKWIIPDEEREHPDYVAAGKRLAFGQAVYDCRVQLGLSEADLAAHARLGEEEVEAIETGGVEPTLELIEALAQAMHAAVRIDPTATSPIRFEAREA